jgi:hypothetical protein
VRFWDAVMGDGVLLARQTGHEGGAGVLVMCSDPQNEVRKPQFLRHGERHTGGRHSERHGEGDTVGDTVGERVGETVR